MTMFVTVFAILVTLGVITAFVWLAWATHPRQMERWYRKFVPDSEGRVSRRLEQAREQGMLVAEQTHELLVRLRSEMAYHERDLHRLRHVLAERLARRADLQPTEAQEHEEMVLAERIRNTELEIEYTRMQCEILEERLQDVARRINEANRQIAMQHAESMVAVGVQAIVANTQWDVESRLACGGPVGRNPHEGDWVPPFDRWFFFRFPPPELTRRDVYVAIFYRFAMTAPMFEAERLRGAYSVLPYNTLLRPPEAIRHRVQQIASLVNLGSYGTVHTSVASLMIAGRLADVSRPDSMPYIIDLLREAQTALEPEGRQAFYADLARVMPTMYENPALTHEHMTTDVVQLARGIWADFAWDRLPILADALQDAGFPDDEALAHLREPNSRHAHPASWLLKRCSA